MRPLILTGAVSAGLLLVVPAPASTQPADPAAAAGEADCAATGFLVGSEAELAALRGELADRPVHELGGVPLATGQTWVVPDGDEPVVVLDATAPVLSGGVVAVSVAGQEYEVVSVDFDAPRDRYVTGVIMPHLGPTVRSLGLSVASGPCQAAVALSVDRSVWSTLAGGGGLAATALFGLLTVLVARLRKGGWGRRFGFAAPFGLLAGVGQSVVLVEAGVVGPFSAPPWWPPLVGLALAALLPLTRWRRRRGAITGPVAAEPPPTGMPPARAPLGGYRLDQPVASTETAWLYRATRGSEQALLKVVRAERFGDPAARLRLEREVRALSGWEHPHVLRLRETISSPDGPPPTLVFSHVEGVALRLLLAGGGTLSGAQAVTVMLGVLAGLQAVHERELVHRDVRPEHVWLTTDGQVLLAGFELACPGIEHPVAPDGVPPYASPEQRAGQPLDRRSDVYACAVLLRELIAEPVPTPVAQLLARALSDDPAGRPDSAQRFAAGLRAAAEQAYGPDWVGRGALAGAVATHAAIGAAAGGYALAGAGAGAGAATGAAGFGAAGSAGSAALGDGQTGTPGLAGVASGAAPTTIAGGPVGAVANAAVAVAAGIAVVAGAVVINPEPAEAQPLLITPDQARVIFVRTMAEAREGGEENVGEGVSEPVEQLLDAGDGIDEAPLTGVEVGVPRDQYDHPAWFVASGQLEYEDGVAYVFTRFDLESDGDPWLMTSLTWSTDEELGTPAVDEAGWLTPAPEPTELVIDPAELPQRYAGWFDEAFLAREVPDDELLAPRNEDTLIVVLTESEVEVFEDGHLESTRLETRPEPTEPVVVWLADGRTLVSFWAVMDTTGYNRPGLTSGPCDADGFADWVHHSNDAVYRELTQSFRLHVLAWVPGADDGGDVQIEDRIVSDELVEDRSVRC